MASITKNPSTLFASGTVLTDSVLNGYCTDASCVAHYLLGSDSLGLVNRKTPGTKDLVPVGGTPVRGVGYASVSQAVGYDTGIALTVPFTVLVYFALDSAGQFVLGNGVGAGTMCIRSEGATVGSEFQKRIRMSGVGGTDYFTRMSPSFALPWRHAAMSVSATVRSDFLPQSDGAANGDLFVNQNGSFSIGASPTLHLGGKDVFVGAGTAAVKIAEVIVLTRAMSAAEMKQTYLDSRRRLQIRLGVNALTAV